MKTTFKWVEYLLEDGTRSRERVLDFGDCKPTPRPLKTAIVMPLHNNPEIPHNCTCPTCLYNKYWEVKK